MDYIKKTICIDGARTKTQGLMPYYAFGVDYSQHSGGCFSVEDLELEIASGENGNWGQFVANPCFLALCGKTYSAMLQKYYDLLNLVRDGIKLRKVETKDGEIIFTEDISGFVLNGECFDSVEEPDMLYEYAAYDAEDFSSTEIESLRDETRSVYRTDVEVDSDFIVLIKDFAKFQNLANYLDGVSIPSSVTTHSIGDDIHTKWADYCQIVDDLIGKINIPASIYNKHIKAPKSMPCADVGPYIEWLENYPSGDCCNARLYEDMGGDEMLEELRKYQGECADKLEALNSLEYAVPYIEMPVLLLQNYTDIGVLTNVDGVECETDAERPHEIGSPTGLTIDEIIMGTSAHTQGDIEVESLLQTFRNRKKYTDDKDNVLPGDFKKFEDSPAGKMFKCVKTGDEWVMNETSETTINGDGKTSEECKNTNFYRTITTCAAGIRIAETEEEENASAATGYYYFLVKYDNSETSPMTIPYKVGNATNVYLVNSATNIYRGDFITEIDTSDDTFKVKYVVGGYFRGDANGNYQSWIRQESGDVYYEEYALDEEHVEYVALDGVDNVPVWSQYIDFEGAAKEFYSTRYGLTRTGNTATIIRLTSGDIWNFRTTAWTTYDAYLTKEEYLTGFSSPPKVDVNVTVDRGGVSAFEKHYKLTECNTMQDLVNYGNNFFNL